MTTFTQPTQVKDALTDLFIDQTLADLEQDLYDQLRDLCRDGASSVEATISVAEICYARINEPLPVPLFQLAADAALYATQANFHGYATTGRGPGIEQALRLVPGVVDPEPPPERSPPEPLEKFMPKPEGVDGGDGAFPPVEPVPTEPSFPMDTVGQEPVLVEPVPVAPEPEPAPKGKGAK